MHQLKLEKKNLNSLTRVLSEDKQKLSTEITYHQNEKQNMYYIYLIYIYLGRKNMRTK